MREMIEVGYNHPSIFTWGLFNEPPASYNLPNQIPSINAVAHAMDSTRYTYIADNNDQNPDIVNAADIEGLNYNELAGPCLNMVKRILNTEYHEGWHIWCYRGCGSATLPGGNQKADDMSTLGYAQDRLSLWKGLLAKNDRTNKLAGATMWCFNDYWSEHSGGVNPMGVVDHMRIPKAVFYLFRKYWTGVPDSVPVPNLTPTQLRLDADTNSLIADSVDVSIITASLRGANGLCVDNTNLGTNTDTIPITFTVNGPANYFGAGIGKLYAGKCALMIKSTNTPGTITITASGKGFTATPITIKSIAPDTSSLPFLTPIRFQGYTGSTTRHLNIIQKKNRIVVSFQDKNDVVSDVRIINGKGEIIPCPFSLSNKSIIVNTKKLSTGYYLLSLGNKTSGNITKKIFIAN